MRQQLRRTFEKLLAREEGARAGADTEDVHRMRVAARRLRTWLKVADSAYERRVVRRYRRELKCLGRTLGAVRDSDVLLADIVTYRERLPGDGRVAVESLAAAADRERGQRELDAMLGSRRDRAFARAFTAFLTTPGCGVPPAQPGRPKRIRDVAGSAIWRRYELWRAYGDELPAADDALLHEARMAGKRLRYTIELFAEALGTRAALALDPLAALQNTLGALQDDVAVQAHIAALGLASDSGAHAYLTMRSAARAGALAALPQQWSLVASAAYRRRLLAILIDLS